MIFTYFKKVKSLALSFSWLALLGQVYAEDLMWQKPEIEKIFRLFPAASESLPKGDSLSVEKLNEVSQKYFYVLRGKEWFPQTL